MAQATTWINLENMMLNESKNGDILSDSETYRKDKHRAAEIKISWRLRGGEMGSFWGA